MKTLSRILFVALFSVALTSCSDDGPVSVNDKDGTALKSSTIGNFSNLTPAYSEDWDGRGTDSERCELNRTDSGWIHWVFSTKGSSTGASLVLSGTGEGEFEPGEPLNAEIWHFYTPFFELDGLEATIFLFGGDKGPGGGLVISDYCPGNGQSLEVSKTVVTSYIRTHDWSIEKEVETDEGHELDDLPKIWLFADGSGDESAEWTVDVTYEGYEDSGWNVSGEITIENIGTSAKLIDSVVDELAGNPIAIECSVNDAPISFPYSLAIGATISCTYSEDVDGQIEGDNVVTVTVDEEENDPFSPYSATEPIVWGDPDSEVNANVDVKDISDLFGTVDLGSLSAADFNEGDVEQFTYDKPFAFADYGASSCGGFQYDNTAEVIGDEDTILDSAEASLKVNVQCFVYESAWAKGDPNESFCDNGFNNWGWTNPMAEGETQEMPLWAGAGRCDTSNGTLVGHVEVYYSQGSISYDYHLFDFHTLKESHFYAGPTKFPQQARGRNGFVNTTAPGQYYIAPNLTGNIWVIAHGVVGIPDPNFGPE
ncbi:MAG: hypothetical protein JJU37_10555 [Balneolaceae bacterium]|nr:hypothetical protein [Balneolaceae bacterium]